MAAIMTATPNPVLISIGQTTGKTTITWNGAENGECQVKEVVGATENVVAPPALQGNLTLDVPLGTHVYVLRPTTGGKHGRRIRSGNSQISERDQPHPGPFVRYLDFAANGSRNRWPLYAR